jgi:hypothetical protein
MRALYPLRRRAVAALASLVFAAASAVYWCHSGSGEANPFVTHKLPASGRSTFRGAVEERLSAGSYVYLRVRTEAEGGVWVASLAAATPLSAEAVDVRVLGRAESFPSKRLSRTFSPLVFAIVRAAPANEGAGSMKEDTP